MRVLHVINSLSGSGGAEQGLVREVVRFSEDVHQLVVRLYSPDGLEGRLTEAGIDTVGLALDSGHSGWNWPAGARRLGRQVERFSPDVIHTSLASANLIGQLAGGTRSTPVLSTFVLSGDPGLMRRYQPGADSWKARVLRKIEQVSARRDHVWFRALTADARDTNAEVAGLDIDRIAIIPRGVPIPDRVESPPRAQLGLPEEGVLILNVGRQTAQKGHGDLVDAFAALRDDTPAHLVILGREGDGSSALRTAMSRKGVEDHVTVIPYTERPYDYYMAADVFAFPSVMEGLGTAALEAMACSLPVVAYDIPPVREITGDGQFARLVPVGDSAAFTKALVEAIDDRESSLAVASKAFENVQAKYSLDGVAHRLESRLRELADRSS